MKSSSLLIINFITCIGVGYLFSQAFDNYGQSVVAFCLGYMMYSQAYQIYLIKKKIGMSDEGN